MHTKVCTCVKHLIDMCGKCEWGKHVYMYVACAHVFLMFSTCMETCTCMCPRADTYSCKAPSHPRGLRSLQVFTWSSGLFHVPVLDLQAWDCPEPTPPHYVSGSCVPLYPDIGTLRVLHLSKALPLVALGRV